MTDFGKQLASEVGEKTALRKSTSSDSFPPFANSHGKVLELNDLYWVDRYRDDNYDDLGFLLPFYNVIENPTLVASKMTDLDTKDVRVVADNAASYYLSWLFQADLHDWMKVKKFGQLLNEMILSWPRYGHLVVKKAKDWVHLVPIQNLYMEPLAESLDNSAWVIEEHDYNAWQLRQEDWNNIDEAVEKHLAKGHLKVYEIRGSTKVSDAYNYFIVATSKDRKGGTLLHFSSEDWRGGKRYRELPWDRVNGRWLGRGQPEKLFHPQIMTNRVASYKSHGLHWTSKHLYQSRDTSIEENLLTDVQDGRILNPNDPIAPVAVEERNLHAYREEEERWDALVASRTFAYDVVRGERTPAGTPLGSAILQSRMAGGYFDLKREDLGLFLKEILYDWVIPTFKKERDIEHRLMLEGIDEARLDHLRNLIANYRANERILDFIGRNSRIPTGDNYRVMKSLTRREMDREREVRIPKGIYKNLKYRLDIIITGEQIDVASRMTTLQTVLQIVGSNPTILRDPNVKKVFYQLLDLAGVSPVMFEETDPGLGETIQGEMAQAKRGGSIARPNPPQTPTAMEVPARL